MAVVENQVVALELEKVIPKIQTLFEREDTFFATIKKRNVEKISNRQMRIPLEIRPGGSFQYFDADGGDLGRGGGPTFDKAVLTSVFLSENIEYTKLTQWATDGDRKSIVNAVRRMTTTAMDELRRQLDSQLMQGGNGVIGTIGVVAAGAGFDTYTLNSDGHGARLIRYGQTVQIFDTTLATNRGSALVTQHDVANKTIQVTPNIAGAVATDLIVVSGIQSPTSLPAIYGVPYHHSNASAGSWLGFSRTATPEIRSNGINAAGNPLTLPLPRLAANQVGNRLGAKKSFKPRIWTHPAQSQAYEEIGQLISVINKGGGNEKLDLYFGEDIQMAGMGVSTSFNWNPARVDFIIEETWGRGEILPLDFYKSDGRKIFEIRGPSGGVATAEIFYMVIGTQFFVMNPAATAYIYNLAVPAGY